MKVFETFVPSSNLGSSTKIRMPSKRYNFAVDESTSEKRIDVALSTLIPDKSRSKLKEIIEEGFVQVNGKTIDHPKYKIKNNDEIQVEIPEEKEIKFEAKNIKLDIRYEDDDLMVINKPEGMVVHPGAGNYEDTLVNALLYHSKNKLSGIGGKFRPGIVHRIDKDTSGLLVVAKNDRSHEMLAKQFEEHSIRRTYEALCYGKIRPSSGTIHTKIGRSKTNRKKMSVYTERGKDAITHYKTIKSFSGKTIPDLSLIECNLETGRTHQIRVHLASKGNSVVGDQTYGRQKKFSKDVSDEIQKLLQGLNRQLLHARSLGFKHPVTNKQMVFESEKPEDFKKLLKALEKLSF